MADDVMHDLQQRAIAAQESAIETMRAIAEQAAFDREQAEAAEDRMAKFRDEEVVKRDAANAAAARWHADVIAIEVQKIALLRRIAEALETKAAR